mmetsp:Transcript_100615/g.165387  ORF Transcript_100615/g.165387 Transcript_100615/m.165387 type:complete len:206 (+) Transcript_100615:159-776(+)
MVATLLQHPRAVAAAIAGQPLPPAHFETEMLHPLRASAEALLLLLLAIGAGPVQLHDCSPRRRQTQMRMLRSLREEILEPEPEVQALSLASPNGGLLLAQELVACQILRRHFEQEPAFAPMVHCAAHQRAGRAASHAQRCQEHHCCGATGRAPVQAPMLQQQQDRALRGPRVFQCQHPRPHQADLEVPVVAVCLAALAAAAAGPC